MSANMTEDQWERRLDELGPFANFEDLVSHLECGKPDYPNFQYLSDYVSVSDPNSRTSK